MKFEFSAGGIVYKKEYDALFILLGKHSQHKGWVFPKGLIDRSKKEKKEEAALREVKEEVGAEGIIERPLEPISYWYVWEGERIKKTVYYFIMRYSGGDITQHDFEMEDVQWIDSEKVVETLTHKSEKELFQKALPEIRELANS